MSSCHRNKIESEEMPFNIKRIINILPPEYLKAIPNDAPGTHAANISTGTGDVVATYLNDIKNNNPAALATLRATDPKHLRHALIEAIKIKDGVTRKTFVASIIQLSKRHFRF